MKIEYKFTDETVEIEVADEWGELIIDLDRQEYNNEHAETRRHCSLEDYNRDGQLIPSNIDLEGDVISASEYERLYRAFRALNPRQKSLIQKVFFDGMSYAEIARAEGVDESAIRHATTRALKKIKKILI